MLLAHATGFHGLVWAPTADHLVAAGRHVWSFDFRGHGDSSRPADGRFEWGGFADDVTQVAQHLGFAGDPSLLAVGHSKGGAALLIAEAQQPGTFVRIWTYEPVVWPTDEPLPVEREHPMSVRARDRRDRWPSPDEAYVNYSSKPPLNVLHPVALRAYVDGGLRRRVDGQWELKCRPADEAEMYAMSVVNGAYQKLDRVQCPLRIVCGAKTQTITPAVGAKLVEHAPHGELEVMGLGHFGPLEDPAACVQSMLEFAKSTP